MVFPCQDWFFEIAYPISLKTQDFLYAKMLFLATKTELYEIIQSRHIFNIFHQNKSIKYVLHGRALFFFIKFFTLTESVKRFTLCTIGTIVTIKPSDRIGGN